MQPYSLNSPEQYSGAPMNAQCKSYSFMSDYDNQYDKPFCQKAQMSYVGPDKVAFGIYKMFGIRENYAPSYSGYNLPNSYLMMGSAGKPGCGCGCK